MMTLHKKLAHLTPEQVDDLITRYYEDEKLASLIEAFNIDAKPAGLVHLFPPLVHEDLPCPYCPDKNLISKRPARTSVPRYPESPHCPGCRHRHTEWCPCKPCRAKTDAARRESEKKKRQLIEATYIRAHDFLPPEDLTLQDAVFLMAIARQAATDDLAYLKPYNEYAGTLAPLPDCQHDIITHLYDRGLIAISPGSEVDAFDFNETLTEIKRHTPAWVLWAFLPSLDVEEKRGYLNRLRTLVSGGDWPDGWSEDVPAVWHYIVKNECLQQFVYLVAKRDDKPQSIDPKIHALFDRLLADFPPSQVFYLTWSTSDDLSKKHIPYRNRKTMSLKAIERKADKAKAGGRALPHFERDRRCPQTDVSATFFNDFLNLGNAAFEAVPPRWDGNCNGTLDIDQGGSPVADSPCPGHYSLYKGYPLAAPSSTTTDNPREVVQ